MFLVDIIFIFTSQIRESLANTHSLTRSQPNCKVKSRIIGDLLCFEERYPVKVRVGH